MTIYELEKALKDIVKKFIIEWETTPLPVQNKFIKERGIKNERPSSSSKLHQ